MVAIHIFYYFGLLAEGGYNDYSKVYSIGEAVAMTLRVPLGYGFSKPEVLFIPISFSVVFIADLVLRAEMSRWWVAIVGIVRLIASSSFPYLLATVFTPLYAPWITFEMSRGTRGETYAENIPPIAGVGWWVIFQILLLVRDLRNRRPVVGLCAKCGYSLAGLGSAVCPECGFKPEVSATS